MPPSVSVIVPTYNRAQLLPAAVRSALSQTLPPLEVIVVDDGSTDATAEVCAALPPPVRYLRQANAGVAAARNHGVRQAQGDWVAFLDSDDLWEPEKLEVQLAALAAAPEAGWSLTGCVLVDGADRPLPGRQGLEAAVPVFDQTRESAEHFFARTLGALEFEAAGARRRAYAGDLFGALFLGNMVIPSAAVVRRDLFLRLGGFDPAFRLAEETEFFHRLAAAAPVVALTAPLLRWRVGHEVRLTANGNVRQLVLNALRSGERAAALRRPLSDAEARAFRLGRQRLLLHAAYVHLSLLERGEARRALREAWRAGAPRTLRSGGLFAASLAPAGALRSLHRVKRLLGR